MFSHHGPFCCWCFCLSCWHGSTTYTWNIIPSYKTHCYRTWDGILAGVCSALLFPFTHFSTDGVLADITDPLWLLRLLRCLSFGNVAVCLGLSLHLSAPLIARDTYSYSFSNAAGSVQSVHFTPRSRGVGPSGKSLTSARLCRHRSLSGFTLQSKKWPSADNSSSSSQVWYAKS